MNEGKTKVLFIHNTAMWYRRPFFKKLSELYDVRLVFTDILVSKDLYGMELAKDIEGLDGVNYRVLKNYLGIAFGVIKEAMGNFDVLVGGSWDSAPELIETIFYFTIAKLRKKPIILYRGDWNWNDKNIKRVLLELLIKMLVKYSNAIVTYGTKSEDYFITLGAHPDHIFKAYNTSIIGSTIANKAVEALRKDLDLKNKKIVLYVGRLEKRKNVDTLIKSFSKLQQELKDGVLLIIGDGECMAAYNALCMKLQLSKDVLFLGMKNNKDLPSYYALCTLFVLPASAEPWGLVLNEAMQFGKPVVATDAVGAAYDLIKNGENGFIVPEKDVDVLYDSMKEIFLDQDLERKMGEESKRIIQNFTYEVMVEGFKKAVECVKN
jgi:glycosyltransferase involved in cell wall biosynthesis